MCGVSAWLYACDRTSATEADCPTGQPVPIASDTMQAVVAHHFVRRGQESIETIDLRDGTTVELYQSGCETVRQEFRFLLPHMAQYPSDSIAVQAAECLRKMATLSPVWSTFAQWATAIENVRAHLSPGVPFMLPGQIQLKVDTIRSGAQKWLIVVMIQT